MLDERQKANIFDAHERGIAMRAIVDADDSPLVTVERAELHHLLLMLAFVSGFALGKSDYEMNQAIKERR